MTAEERFLAQLRANPRSSPKRVARELGVSGRAARRLMAQLEAEGVVSARRSRWLVLAVLAFAGSALGAIGLGPKGTVAVPPPQPVAPEAQAKERELYGALDRRDPARVDLARAELKSEEEVVRLAALRYLAGVDADAHAPELLPLFDDPSERVRPVALQLLGRVPGRTVEDALVAVLLRTDRPQSDRLLALTCLRDRPPSSSLAPSVLPVLLDEAPALREQTAALLGRLTRKTVETSSDARTLHAAWRDALGVSE